MTFVIRYQSHTSGLTGDTPYVTYAEAETVFRRMVRQHPNGETLLIRWADTGAIGAPLLHYDPHADTPHRWQDSLPGLSPDPLRRAAQIALAAIVLALDATDTTPEMAEVLESARDGLESVL